MQGEMRGIIMVWRFHRCHGSCTDGEHAVHVYVSAWMRVDQAVGVPGLSAYGVTTEHHAAIAEKAGKASSMKVWTCARPMVCSPRDWRQRWHFTGRLCRGGC